MSWRRDPHIKHLTTTKLRRMAVRTLALLIGMLLIQTSAAAQQPELLVEVDRTEIYQGESFRYNVTFNHFDDSGGRNSADSTKPILDGFDDFEVKFLGDRSLSSQRITIINGRRSEEIRRGHEFQYQLTPKHTGTLTIPAPSAQVDGEELMGAPLVVRVVPPDEQTDVSLELSASRDQVYPMQTFTIELKVYVRGLPGDYEEVDPLSIQRDPPALDIPWLVDDYLPEGIEPLDTFREILDPLVDRGRGFQINGYRSQSIFSLLQPEAVRFHPTPKRIFKPDDQGDSVEYWEYTIRRAFRSRRLGSYEFGPVTVKGIFNADTESNGQLRGKRIYAAANRVVVKVIDAPAEGRPEGYIKAFGQYQVDAGMSPTQGKVGDPLTYTLTIRGDGSLDSVRAPDLEQFAAVRDGFRIYEAEESKLRDGRRFTYRLRPLHSTVTEFPSIPVAYFDPMAGEYVSEVTAAIPLKISESEYLAGADVFAEPSELNSAGGSGLERSNAGLFGNRSDPRLLRDDWVRPARWLGLWGGMSVTYLACLAAIAIWRREQSNPAAQRRRTATSRARKLLHEAGRMVQSADLAGAIEQYRSAIAGLIADHTGLSQASLTPREAADSLKTMGIDDQLVDDTENFFQRCDASRYGSALDKDETQKLADRANTLISQLDHELRGKRPRVGGAALLLLLLSIGGCAPGPDAQQVLQFENAESAFDEAQSREDYIRVAGQYQQLLDSGLRSGVVLFNQGNAWMEAGEYGRAIASYRQAKRIRPRDPYLDANLRQAYQATNATPPENGAGIFQTLLFWQDWLGYRGKFAITTGLFAVILVTTLAWILVPAYRRILTGFFVVMLAMFAVASASTGWDYVRYETRTHGVITNDEVTAYKGASKNQASAFTTPLRQGTEFIVLSERNDWLEVRIAAAGNAWIQRRDAVTY